MQSEKEMQTEREMKRISRQILVAYRKLANEYDVELRRERYLDAFFNAASERWLNPVPIYSVESVGQNQFTWIFWPTDTAL